jgi:hypothetical protein
MFYTILLCKYILFVNEDVVHGIVFMECHILGRKFEISEILKQFDDGV